MAIQITDDADADQVLTDDPFALLVGMMLDQQYPMEHAFRGPAKVLTGSGPRAGRHRGGRPRGVRDALRDAARDPPLPRVDGRAAADPRRAWSRTYDGHADADLDRGRQGPDLMRPDDALPGFGKQKAQIFVALLAKQLGVRPTGWEQAVGAYAEDGYRSVADVVDADSLQKVRDFKKAKRRPRRRPAEVLLAWKVPG